MSIEELESLGEAIGQIMTIRTSTEVVEPVDFIDEETN